MSDGGGSPLSEDEGRNQSDYLVVLGRSLWGRDLVPTTNLVDSVLAFPTTNLVDWLRERIHYVESSVAMPYVCPRRRRDWWEGYGRG